MMNKEKIYEVGGVVFGLLWCDWDLDIYIGFVI